MIDLSTLNAAQREAVTAGDGSTLVVAGAGSGKTRTLVHRLVWLVEQGLDPAHMLLLTFTRKASQEMLLRAQGLLNADFRAVQGGTFHGFAYSVLRQYRPAWAHGPVTIMDPSDCASLLQQCRETLKIAKGSRLFPKSQTILSLFSKSRNKEMSLGELLHRESPHLLQYEDELQSLAAAYTAARREHNLLDYDDLLFELELLLNEKGEEAEILDVLRRRFKHVLVDEYQDTNRVQARLVQLLAGNGGNVMAVGDDAQSIYAFRGADIRNILHFPQLFPKTRIIRLEENYRSTRPVLDIANAVLAGATMGYAKNLFTRKTEGAAVRLLRPLSDLTQARLVARRIEELLLEHPAHEIAVLFRAGFHSYHLEVELTRAAVPFRKYGGLKYTEAAHIKDLLAYVRLIINPLDMPAFQRVAGFNAGVGPKTAQKMYAAAANGETEKLYTLCKKFPNMLNDLSVLSELRHNPPSPQACLTRLMSLYQDRLESNYPDDWPRRLQGLEELRHIAATYDALDAFISDLSLENPTEERETEGGVVLSTIHSAKGLEWNAVIVLDLVEDRFPSRRAALCPEDFEEERRLMYVACTRARQQLDLSAPVALYDRQRGGSNAVMISPFLQELSSEMYEVWQESVAGVLAKQKNNTTMSWQTPHKAQYAYRASTDTSPLSDIDACDVPMPNAVLSAGSKEHPCGFCRHKIFGRGKVVERLDGEKCRVNFPGLGLKVIMTAFLTFEE